MENPNPTTPPAAAGVKPPAAPSAEEASFTPVKKSKLTRKIAPVVNDSTMSDTDKTPSESSPNAVASEEKSEQALVRFPIPEGRISVCVSFPRRTDPESAYRQLAQHLQLKEDHLRGGIRADKISPMKDSNGYTFHLHRSEAGNRIYFKLKQLQEEGKKPQNFNLVLRVAAVADPAEKAQALFITFSFDLPPETVAIAIAKHLLVDAAFVGVRRGQQSTMDYFRKMYYIVDVAPADFERAMGTVVTAPTRLGAVSAMLAPSVKWQFENSYRRFRFTITGGDIDIPTVEFIQALQESIGKVAFWDRGRREDGQETPVISVSVMKDSDTARGLNELIDELGTSEGEVEGLPIRFKLAELTQEEYQQGEARRTKSMRGRGRGK